MAFTHTKVKVFTMTYKKLHNTLPLFMSLILSFNPFSVSILLWSPPSLSSCYLHMPNTLTGLSRAVSSACNALPPDTYMARSLNHLISVQILLSLLWQDSKKALRLLAPGVHTLCITPLL